MDALARDVRFALRLIRKSPVLSIATIVTLALGIGLNAGVFTVLSGLLFRARVTVDPGSFVHLQATYSGEAAPRVQTTQLSTRDYLALRDRATTVRSLAAWSVLGARLGDSGAELTLLVSCDFFSVYGLDRFERGRAFLPDECRTPGVPVAVISDELWRRRFGADPGILNIPLTLNGQAFTIVGVVPPDFSGRLRGPGIWIPYATQPLVTRGQSVLDDPGVAWLWADGRLKPGASREAAQAEMNLIIR
jgi:hypothetical protein